MADALAAIVTTAPDGSPPPTLATDTLYVITPLYDGGRTKWPCRWAGGVAVEGQACVMVQTDDRPWALGL